jgi:hypothetical protein
MWENRKRERQRDQISVEMVGETCRKHVKHKKCVQISVGQTVGKRSLGEQSHRWEDIILNGDGGECDRVWIGCILLKI